MSGKRFKKYRQFLTIQELITHAELVSSLPTVTLLINTELGGCDKGHEQLNSVWRWQDVERS